METWAVVVLSAYFGGLVVLIALLVLGVMDDFLGEPRNKPATYLLAAGYPSIFLIFVLLMTIVAVSKLFKTPKAPL